MSVFQPEIDYVHTTQFDKDQMTTNKIANIIGSNSKHTYVNI